MSLSEPWECVVVGAGIVGSWTAYHLASQGVKTLLIEQFVLPHTRGSSHGQSRIIRKTYNKDFYTRMMPEAYDMWHRLEREFGKQVLVPTGLLVIQGGNQNTLRASEAAMKRTGIPGETIDGAELKRRYPMFDFPADHAAVVDQSGGLLLPDRCLNALHSLFVARGGVIADGAPVDSITPGDIVVVKTKRGTYHTKRLILTPGPWARDLLSKINVDVPIKTMPGRVAYWKTRRPDAHSIAKIPIVVHWFHGLPEGQYNHVYLIPVSEYTNMLKTMPGRSAYWRDTSQKERYSVPSGTPITIHNLEPPEISEKYRFYSLFPTLEYPGLVKIVTRGEPPARYVHPDSRDKDEKGEMVALLSEYISKHFPGVETKPSIIEPCVYSMTPDKDYIIDRHPRHPNIAFGCGFSGHGFKTAPVIGKLLLEIVYRKKPSYDLAPFKFDRNYNLKSQL